MAAANIGIAKSGADGKAMVSRSLISGRYWGDRFTTEIV
jgi:hypothetical protein